MKCIQKKLQKNCIDKIKLNFKRYKEVKKGEWVKRN